MREIPQVEALVGLVDALPLAIGEAAVIGTISAARRSKRTLVVKREQEFLSLAECATELGLGSAAGLRVQVRRGALRADRMAGKWFVTRDEVERYRRESLGRHGRKLSGSTTE